MNRTSQAKYLGLGLLAGIGVMLLIAAGGGGGANVGKYQISAAPQRVYIINTANGQVWEKNINVTGGEFNSAKE